MGLDTGIRLFLLVLAISLVERAVQRLTRRPPALDHAENLFWPGCSATVGAYIGIWFGFIWAVQFFAGTPSPSGEDYAIFVLTLVPLISVGFFALPYWFVFVLFPLAITYPVGVGWAWRGKLLEESRDEVRRALRPTADPIPKKAFDSAVASVYHHLRFGRAYRLAVTTITWRDGGRPPDVFGPIGERATTDYPCPRCESGGGSPCYVCHGSGISGECREDVLAIEST